MVQTQVSQRRPTSKAVDSPAPLPFEVFASGPIKKRSPNHSKPVQYLRLIALWVYFWTCVFILAITQFLGAPLYLIHKPYFYKYMAFSKEGMSLLVLSMTQWWSPTVVYLSGDESVQGQIRKSTDGTVECAFASRMLLMSNHQIYSDWVYLWWTAYMTSPKLHGHIIIVLKQVISYIPIVGLGLRFAGFIFMSRKMATDQPRLARRMSQLTRADKHGQLVPMWLMMFPEGTNLGVNGRRKSSNWAKRQGISDLRHCLIPRSSGTYFCLKALDASVEWVYDCTLAYDGVPKGEYGQDVFTLHSSYIDGRPPPVHMHWRRFSVSSIPLSTLEAFDEWLQARWLEKDILLDQHARTGQFPSKLADGEPISTIVKLGHWSELWRLGGVLVAVGVGFLGFPWALAMVKSR